MSHTVGTASMLYLPSQKSRDLSIFIHELLIFVQKCKQIADNYCSNQGIILFLQELL